MASFAAPAGESPAGAPAEAAIDTARNAGAVSASDAIDASPAPAAARTAGTVAAEAAADLQAAAAVAPAAGRPPALADSLASAVTPPAGTLSNAAPPGAAAAA